jgi:hypothetical protein
MPIPGPSFDMEFNIQVPVDTLSHYMHGMQESRVVKGTPTEAERSPFDPDATDAYFQTLEQFLRDFSDYLVNTFNETGHQEWVDAHAESVVVPSSYKSKTICVPGNRGSQRSMLLGADSSNYRGVAF